MSESRRRNSPVVAASLKFLPASLKASFDTSRSLSKHRGISPRLNSARQNLTSIYRKNTDSSMLDSKLERSNPVKETKKKLVRRTRKLRKCLSNLPNLNQIQAKRSKKQKIKRNFNNSIDSPFLKTKGIRSSTSLFKKSPDQVSVKLH